MHNAIFFNVVLVPQESAECRTEASSKRCKRERELLHDCCQTGQPSVCYQRVYRPRYVTLDAALSDFVALGQPA